MGFDRELVREASEVWCPDFPRKTVNANTGQFTVTDRDQLIESLEAVSGCGPGYISTYSFPRGHSKDGYIPAVNTLMYDLDVPTTKEYERGDADRWHRDMSGLLARVRMVARFLCDSDMDRHWRASLSGFKGVHFYQDFPTIHPDNGNQNQFKDGLGEYADRMIGFLERETHVELAEWVDVNSHDLGRLTRNPNTIHTGATKFFGEERWCVPVSLRELATIQPADYAELTAGGPRPLPDDCQRVEDPHAGVIITEYIRNAFSGGLSDIDGYTGKRSGDHNFLSVKDYEEKVANHNITSLADVKLLTEDRPCVWAYHERNDQFEHGAASHTMEVYVMSELVWKNVPIAVILEFFEGMNGYSEKETMETLKGVINANWQNRHSCGKVQNDVDGLTGRSVENFCIGETCGLYDGD